MQTVQQNDLIKAAFGFNELIKLYDSDPTIIKLTYDEIASKLDVALQPRFDAAKSSANNLDPNDPNNQL